MNNKKNSKNLIYDEYNRIKYIADILYPPVLYAFIQMGVQFAGNIYYTYLYSKNIDNNVTVEESYHFVDGVDKMIQNHSYILTMISAIIGLVIFIILYELDGKRYERPKFIEQITHIKPYRLGYIIILGIAGNIGLSRLLSLLPIDNIMGSYENTQELLMAGKLLIQIVSISVLIPMTEELIYRGLVCERLKRLVGDKIAIVASAILFALFHFNLLQAIYAFIIGLVLGYLYIKYDNVMYCIILHSVANLTAVLVNYFKISQTINRFLLLYLVVMIIELAVAIFASYKIYKSKD